MSDPKRGRRVIDKTASPRKLIAEPSCRVCGERATNCHHLLQRGSPYFGDDVPGNLIPLCGSGTTGCHGDVENRAEVARRRIGLRLDASEVAYLLLYFERDRARAADYLIRTYYLTQEEAAGVVVGQRIDA